MDQVHDQEQLQEQQAIDRAIVPGNTIQWYWSSALSQTDP
jgi:hypothetical protein